MAASPLRGGRRCRCCSEAATLGFKVEPPVVIQAAQDTSSYLLLDGHLRIEVTGARRHLRHGSLNSKNSHPALICVTLGSGWPSHLYSRCAPVRTLLTRAGRKQTTQSFPGLRTLRTPVERQYGFGLNKPHSISKTNSKNAAIAGALAMRADRGLGMSISMKPNETMRSGI
jgi:hypothetical protein